MRSVMDETTNTSPTLEPVSDGQEQVDNLMILVIATSAGIALIVLLVGILVIGILVFKRKRQSCSIPNATSHYEFQTRYGKGIYVVVLA